MISSPLYARCVVIKYRVQQGELERIWYCRKPCCIKSPVESPFIGTQVSVVQRSGVAGMVFSRSKQIAIIDQPLTGRCVEVKYNVENNTPCVAYLCVTG